MERFSYANYYLQEACKVEELSSATAAADTQQLSAAAATTSAVASKMPSSTSSTIGCQLCPAPGGAMKRTADQRHWIHGLCGFYMPEVSFLNKQSMEDPVLDGIPAFRYEKMCSICESDGELINAQSGACIRCNASSACDRWFHVTCAMRVGLLCDHNVDGKVAYCQQHLDAARSEQPTGLRVIPPFKLGECDKENAPKSGDDLRVDDSTCKASPASSSSLQIAESPSGGAEGAANTATVAAVAAAPSNGIVASADQQQPKSSEMNLSQMCNAEAIIDCVIKNTLNQPHGDNRGGPLRLSLLDAAAMKEVGDGSAAAATARAFAGIPLEWSSSTIASGTLGGTSITSSAATEESTSTSKTPKTPEKKVKAPRKRAPAKTSSGEKAAGAPRRSPKKSSTSDGTAELNGVVNADQATPPKKRSRRKKSDEGAQGESDAKKPKRRVSKKKALPNPEHEFAALPEGALSLGLVPASAVGETHAPSESTATDESTAKKPRRRGRKPAVAGDSAAAPKKRSGGGRKSAKDKKLGDAIAAAGESAAAAGDLLFAQSNMHGNFLRDNEATRRLVADTILSPGEWGASSTCAAGSSLLSRSSLPPIGNLASGCAVDAPAKSGEFKATDDEAAVMSTAPARSIEELLEQMSTLLPQIFTAVGSKLNVLELLNAVDRLRQENVTLQRECEELRSRNVGLSQNCALLSNGAAGGKVVDFGVIGPLAGMPLTTSTAATAAPVQAKAPVRRRATKKKSTEDDATAKSSAKRTTPEKLKAGTVTDAKPLGMQPILLTGNDGSVAPTLSVADALPLAFDVPMAVHASETNKRSTSGEAPADFEPSTKRKRSTTARSRAKPKTSEPELSSSIAAATDGLLARLHDTAPSTTPSSTAALTTRTPSRADRKPKIGESTQQSPTSSPFATANTGAGRLGSLPIVTQPFSMAAATVTPTVTPLSLAMLPTITTATQATPSSTAGAVSAAAANLAAAAAHNPQLAAAVFNATGGMPQASASTLPMLQQLGFLNAAAQTANPFSLQALQALQGIQMFYPNPAFQSHPAQALFPQLAATTSGATTLGSVTLPTTSASLASIFGCSSPSSASAALNAQSNLFAGNAQPFVFSSPSAANMAGLASGLAGLATPAHLAAAQLQNAAANAFTGRQLHATALQPNAILQATAAATSGTSSLDSLVGTTAGIQQISPT